MDCCETRRAISEHRILHSQPDQKGCSRFEYQCLDAAHIWEERKMRHACSIIHQWNVEKLFTSKHAHIQGTMQTSTSSNKFNRLSFHTSSFLDSPTTGSARLRECTGWTALISKLSLCSHAMSKRTTMSPSLGTSARRTSTASIISRFVLAP